MGMYNRQTTEKLDPWKIHPIWRGIGCILIIVIPIFSFALAHTLIEANISNIGIPTELRATVDTIILGPVRFFPAKALAGVVLSVLLFAIVTFIYALMYRISGQGARGPLDAPPVRHRPKKRDL